MKKLVLLSLFIVAMATAAFAQPRAIGGRLVMVLKHLINTAWVKAI